MPFVNLAVHILLDGMPYRLVRAVYARVGRKLVRYHLRVRFRVVKHETLKRPLVNVTDRHCAYLVRLTVFDSRYRSLAYRSPSRIEPLAGVLVLLLPAYVGFVCLYRAGDLVVYPRIPRLTNTVRHVPSRLLRDSQVTVQLH